MSNVAVKNKKPFGFYVCSLAFSFERCAFYTVKYLLSIWIAVKLSAGGLGMSTAEAASISALFVAMTYITPMIGGYIADYWLSPRICVISGMLLMGAGYLVAWQADNIAMVWIMIALVSIGTGLFKGNLSGISGLLFSDKRELNEAFSIQYSFVNIGSFIGTTFLVLLARPFGYNFVFLVAAIMLFINAAWFIFNQKALGNAGKKPFKYDQRQFEEGDEETDEDTSNKPLTTTDKKRIFAIILVILFSVIFWMVWYLAYMPAYYYFGYGDGEGFLERANWMIGNFKVPTSYFDSINAFTCIALGPILGKLWTKLSERPQGDLSMFQKTAIGMMLVGVSYLVMVFSDFVGNGNASVLWLALVCILMSVGEMVFSPLGNSFISKLAPAKLLGFLLGLWPIAVFFSTLLYPKLYEFLQTDVPAEFQKGYGILGIIVIGLGIALWAFSGKLSALEKDEDEVVETIEA